MLYSLLTSKVHKKRYGFTLLELMVVVSIFTIMSALLVANYRRFGNNVTLANTAYEVAQGIREVQTYGLSSRAGSTGVSTNTGADSIFRKRYGFYVISNKEYVLFSDQNNDGVYSLAGNDIILSRYVLPTDLVFAQRCVIGGTTGGVPNNPSSVGSAVIHMTFFRPNPDAQIRGWSGTPDSKQYSQARLCLSSSSSGKFKEIRVFGSGQIEVVDVSSCVCS